MCFFLQIKKKQYLCLRIFRKERKILMITKTKVGNANVLIRQCGDVLMQGTYQHSPPTPEGGVERFATSAQQEGNHTGLPQHQHIATLAHYHISTLAHYPPPPHSLIINDLQAKTPPCSTAPYHTVLQNGFLTTKKIQTSTLFEHEYPCHSCSNYAPAKNPMLIKKNPISIGYSFYKHKNNNMYGCKILRPLTKIQSIK